jgi:hypothetical protein
VKLLEYNYKVESKKGKENIAVDALSRIDNSSQAHALTVVTPLWITEVQDNYNEDDKCKELLAKLSIDPQAEIHYTMNNGILRYRGKIVVGDSSELRTSIIKNFHSTALGGHSGEQPTYKRIKLLFH